MCPRGGTAREYLEELQAKLVADANSHFLFAFATLPFTIESGNFGHHVVRVRGLPASNSVRRWIGRLGRRSVRTSSAFCPRRQPPASQRPPTVSFPSPWPRDEPLDAKRYRASGPAQTDRRRGRIFDPKMRTCLLTVALFAVARSLRMPSGPAADALTRGHGRRELGRGTAQGGSRLAVFDRPAQRRGRRRGAAGGGRERDHGARAAVLRGASPTPAGGRLRPGVHVRERRLERKVGPSPAR